MLCTRVLVPPHKGQAALAPRERAVSRIRSGAGRSRSTVKPEGTSDNSEGGSRTDHEKQSGSCQYRYPSRIIHRPAPKVRKNPGFVLIHILFCQSARNRPQIGIQEGSLFANRGKPGWYSISTTVLEAPAFVADLDDIVVMGQSIRQHGCHLGVAGDARPVGEGEIGRDDVEEK